MGRGGARCSSPDTHGEEAQMSKNLYAIPVSGHFAPRARMDSGSQVSPAYFFRLTFPYFALAARSHALRFFCETSFLQASSARPSF